MSLINGIFTLLGTNKPQVRKYLLKIMRIEFVSGRRREFSDFDMYLVDILNLNLCPAVRGQCSFGFI